MARAVADHGVIPFLTRSRGRHRLHWTDWLTYAYLALGIFLMFGPVVWVLLSSFKTQAQLLEFPPSLLPYGQVVAEVEGYDQPLPLCRVELPAGEERVLAQVRRVGIQAQLVDPDAPDELIKVNIDDREPVRAFSVAWSNYTELFELFNFGRYLWNSVFITVTATLIMLVINSMAAFALAKYDFRGRGRGLRADHRDADDPTDDRAGAELPRGLRARAPEHALGGDLARGGDADRRFPPAPVHADDPGRTDRCRAHGPCERVEDLLADRPAALGASTRRARDLRHHVALE